jgi:hypothetical protein
MKGRTIAVVLTLSTSVIASISTPLVQALKDGLVSDVKVEADPSAVLVSVTDKFTAMPIDRETAIAGSVCSAVSAMSQEKRDGGAETTPVGLCDLVLVGTNNKIGATIFDDDGKPVTQWEPWYLRAKKK